MPWSIDIDEFTADGASHLTTTPEGLATFELEGRYSAMHIVRIPQLPRVELYDAKATGEDEPLARAETLSFTMLPQAEDDRQGRWALRARARLGKLPKGTLLKPVLTDATQSMRVPSARTLEMT
jgi:hypothetical protein